MSTPDYYTSAAPRDQLAVDIFKGEWSSCFPKSSGLETGGTAGLFEDERIHWATRQLATHGQSVAGSHALEIGPLEGGHTVMLENAGAESITAIEANSRAYLKCLVTKEIMGLGRSRFLFGDALAYLGEETRSFDVAIACGILYHMTDPVRFLELLTQRCEHVYLWTVYYDAGFCAEHPEYAAKFTAHTEYQHAGFDHHLHRYEYQDALNWQGFCGGPRPFCQWMERDEILGALHHFGFTQQSVRDEPNPHGNALSVVASKA